MSAETLFELTKYDGTGLSPVDAWACTLDGVMATAPDGQVIPITDCAWMQSAPCGCVNGITMVHASKMLLTAEQAMREMASNKADAREDARLGYRMTLVRMTDYRPHLMDLMTGKCPHTPMWGHERATREVDGVGWVRFGSTDWRHEDWRIEKLGRYWIVWPPRDVTVPRRSLSSQLDDSLALASRMVAAEAAS